jgi:hypothetical protein
MYGPFGGCCLIDATKHPGIRVRGSVELRHEQRAIITTEFATELGSTRRDERRRRPRNYSKLATDWELKGQAETC